MTKDLAETQEKAKPVVPPELDNAREIHPVVMFGGNQPVTMGKGNQPVKDMRPNFPAPTTPKGQDDPLQASEGEPTSGGKATEATDSTKPETSPPKNSNTEDDLPF